MPIGCAVYGLRPEALRTICEIKKEVNTEIWGTLINLPEVFDVFRIESDQKLGREKLRIITDYIEDYEFIQALYSPYQE